MKNFLFPKPAESTSYSLFLLAVRLLFGFMFMIHGLEKIFNYTELVASFPDPLSLGNQMSLILAIIAELFCPIAFIFGFLYRLFLIPMIIIMAVAFIGVHNFSLGEGELAFLYFLMYIMMYIAGAGKYSVDALIYKSMNAPLDMDDDDLL